MVTLFCWHFLYIRLCCALILCCSWFYWMLFQTSQDLMFLDHGLTVERTKSRTLSFLYLNGYIFWFPGLHKIFVKYCIWMHRVYSHDNLMLRHFFNIVLDIHRSKTYWGIFCCQYCILCYNICSLHFWHTFTHLASCSDMQLLTAYSVTCTLCNQACIICHILIAIGYWKWVLV